MKRLSFSAAIFSLSILFLIKLFTAGAQRDGLFGFETSFAPRRFSSTTHARAMPGPTADQGSVAEASHSEACCD